MLSSMFFAVCGIIIHPHLNRPSQILHSAMPAAPEVRESRGLPLDKIGQDHIETVVHLKGEDILHHGVHDALVQLGGHFVSLAAQFDGHTPDLAAVKVDGGHPLGVAAVAHLIALAVEPVAAAAVGQHHLAVAQDSHSAEDIGQVLPGPVQAGLAVHLINCCKPNLGKLRTKFG